MGCSADVDTELGYDILPENQKMEMRHLTFKGGQVISFVKGNTADENGIVGGEYHKRDGRFFETRLYQTDSMLSSNVTYLCRRFPAPSRLPDIQAPYEYGG